MACFGDDCDGDVADVCSNSNNNKWGTVCSDYFTEKAAHVTCKTLNPDAKTVTSFKKTCKYLKHCQRLIIDYES